VLRRLRSFIDVLFRRGRFEREMSDEMKFHMDAYADDLARSGLPRVEAVRRARMEFGAVETAMEDCRQARGVQHWDELRQDLRYATRQMARAPVFTAAAIASLGLGIGANTAIFSLMDAVLLRMLPLENPQDLYYLGHGAGMERDSSIAAVLFSPEDISTSANYPLLERYQGAAVFEGVTAYEGETLLVATAEGIERVNGQFVSGNYHAVLGVPVILGRGFSTERDRDIGATPIAVISDGYWTRKFGRNPDVIGRTLIVHGRTVTIVGVTAPGFDGLTPGWPIDLTLPMSVRAMDDPRYLDARDGWVSLSLVGRVQPGVSEAEALAVVDPLFRQFWMEPENAWAREGSSATATRRAALVPAGRGSGDLRDRYATPLGVLMGMVGVVLLIACANVANLLLARAAARAREVAVRLSIGAGRMRLVRQFLTESLLLALSGGALGLLVAIGSIGAILSMIGTGEYPVVLEVSLNARVLAFTMAVSILTGIAFGLVPAIGATRPNLTNTLKGIGAVTAHGRRATAGKTLVIAQIALCILVVGASGLLVRSLRNLKTLDAGFVRANVLLFNVETTEPPFSEERRASFYSDVLDRVRALPGVVSASLSKRSPIDFSSELRRIEIPGMPDRAAPGGVSSNVVTPDYFETLGIGLVRGRGLSNQDRMGSPMVALVSESMARTYFGEADALGRTIFLGGRKDTLSIVGIVRDARHEGLREGAPPSVYTPLAQPGEEFEGTVGVPDELTAAIRTNGDPRQLARSVRTLVREIDDAAAVSYVRTMEQQLDAALVRERLLANLSTGLGFLALLLAALGLYGVMSYSVARRVRESGIRIALGATPADMMWNVLREVLVVSLIGVAVGLGATLASGRIIAAILFELSPRDPITLGAVGALLVVTALAAGYVPARKAASVQPIQALRAD
jgi:predicted permease